ncbi:hypothetical protein [uncultured Brachyspira sp.]|nr:hypothetical protein [uncultured Brachyspira sp.]
MNRAFYNNMPLVFDDIKQDSDNNFSEKNKFSQNLFSLNTLLSISLTILL